VQNATDGLDLTAGKPQAAAIGTALLSSDPGGGAPATNHLPRAGVGPSRPSPQHGADAWRSRDYSRYADLMISLIREISRPWGFKSPLGHFRKTNVEQG